MNINENIKNRRKIQKSYLSLTPGRSQNAQNVQIVARNHRLTFYDRIRSLWSKLSLHRYYKFRFHSNFPLLTQKLRNTKSLNIFASFSYQRIVTAHKVNRCIACQISTALICVSVQLICIFMNIKQNIKTLEKI